MIHPGSTHYIDIHTHDKISRAGVFCLPSIFIQSIELRRALNEPFSAGLHPWHLNQVDVTNELNSLQMLAGNEMIRAIGECGLDRNISVNFDMQRDVFIQQMKLANSHQKPLIIHAVKSYSDFLNIIKNYGIKTKWIFHGFNGNGLIAKKLLKHEGVYLSFGPALLHDNSYTARVLKDIDVSRLLLETDESMESIEQVYTKAAEVLEMDGITLKKQLFKNYMEVFDV